MKQIDFVIFYEHWQRELYGCTLLKLELEKRGYSVVLDHFPFNVYLDTIRNSHEPKVVVYPWLYSGLDVRRALNFRKRPYHIVNLQSEQVLSDFTFRWRPKMPRDEAKKGYHVCWGELTKQRMINAGIKEENVRNVGNINLDITQKIFRDLFPTKKEMADKYGLDDNRPWVMFFSNFKFARMNEKELDFYVNEAPAELREFARKRIDENKAEYVGTSNLLLEFVKTKPEALIIYRFHPVERKAMNEALKEMERYRDDFVCINDGSIQDWIPACDMFLTTDSTSVDDVYCVGKPFALIKTVSHNKVFLPDTFRNCNYVHNVAELNYAISHRDDYQTFDANVFDESISNIQNKDYSFRLLADWLEEIIVKEKDVYGKLPLTEFYNTVSLIKRIKRILINCCFNLIEKYYSRFYNDGKNFNCKINKYITLDVDEHRFLKAKEQEYEDKLKPYFNRI